MCLRRHWLHHNLSNLDDLAENDYRRTLPWWRPENLVTNQRLLDVVRTVATSHDCTPGRIALAWILAKGPDVVPIPGTKRQRYLTENLDALNIELTPAEIAELDALRPAGPDGQRGRDEPHHRRAELTDRRQAPTTRRPLPSVAAPGRRARCRRPRGSPPGAARMRCRESAGR
ncbi:MAG: aldo/keto reductase [Actinomycetota bacterium]|nr:aldo/keto reductase [Actinomycetota bacterium]